MSSNSIGVVIPLRNSLATIHSCIVALMDQVTPSNIVVVSNGTQDGSDKIPGGLGCRVIYCEKESAAAARNKGWQALDTDYVAFIDSDVLVEKTWVQKTLSHCMEKNHIGCQSLIIPIPNKTKRKLDSFRVQWKHLRTKGTLSEYDSSGVLNTAACLYRRDILKLTGGFDEAFTRLEDFELTLRAQHYGTLSTCHEAVARVLYSGSSLQYFCRSFRDGMNFYSLTKKWKSLPRELEFHTFTVNFQHFEVLRSALFYMGRYFARLIELHAKIVLLGGLMIHLGSLSASELPLDFQAIRKEMLSHIASSLRKDIQLRKCLSVSSTSEEYRKEGCADFTQKTIEDLQKKIKRDYGFYTCFKKAHSQKEYTECTGAQ